MKNNRFLLILTVALGVINFPAFAYEIRNNLKTANGTLLTASNLNNFGTDSSAKYKKYIYNADLRILKNDSSIAGLKAKKLTGDKESIKLFIEKVLILEKINNELKKRLDETVTVNLNNWPAFSSEFDRDMADLERSITKLLVEPVDPVDKTSNPIRP